jgi:hypothetical protein
MRRRKVRAGCTVWADQGTPYVNVGGCVWTFGKPGPLAVGAEYRRRPYSTKKPYRGLVALADLLPATQGLGTKVPRRGDSRRSRSSTTGVG